MASLRRCFIFLYHTYFEPRGNGSVLFSQDDAVSSIEGPRELHALVRRSELVEFECDHFLVIGPVAAQRRCHREAGAL